MMTPTPLTAEAEETPRLPPNETGGDEEEIGLRRRRIYFVVIIVFVLNLLNYLDRVVIGFAADQMTDDFQIDAAQFGFLNTAFNIGALVSNVTCGFVLDRFGVRYIWTAAIFIWSATMVAQGYIESYNAMVGVRVLMGLAEGINFIAMDRAHADWVPSKQSSTAFAVSLLGVFLASLIGSPLFSHTIAIYGWRPTFVGLGIGGFVIGLVYFVAYKEQDASKKNTSKGLSLRKELRILLLDRDLMAVSWSFFAFGYVLWLALTWLPTYLQSLHSISLEAVGIISIAPWAVACVLLLVGGTFSDCLLEKTQNLRISLIYVIATLQVVSCICFVPLIFVTNDISATVCITLAVGIGMGNNAMYYTFCAQRFPEYAGQATGIMVSFFTLSGIVCPSLTGWIIDTTGSFAAVFGVVCGVTFSAVIGLLAFAWPDLDPVRDGQAVAERPSSTNNCAKDESAKTAPGVDTRSAISALSVEEP